MIGDVLQSPSLEQTFHQLQLIEAANDILHEGIHSSLAQHIRVANIQRNTVSIMAEDAEWATRARLESDAILFALQQNPLLSQHGIMLGNIKFLVKPHETKRKVQERRAERPSRNTGFQMIADAKDLPEGLAKAMKRLAGKAR